jgi:hypothetical protein
VACLAAIAAIPARNANIQSRFARQHAVSAMNRAILIELLSPQQRSGFN